MCLCLLSHGRPDQLLISYPPIDDPRQDGDEPFKIACLSRIVAKRLLIEIAEQMERGNPDVGSLESALQQAPEVFEAIRVNAAMNVLNRMVYNLMFELLVQSLITGERIAAPAFTCSLTIF